MLDQRELIKKKEIHRKMVERLFFFLNLYRFQGSQERNLMYFENCTARWKTSCKETSCECVRRHAQKCDNFAVGLRRKANQRKIFDSYSDSDDQVTKGAGWMPWHWTPKKDVVSCEKPRGAASRL